MQERSNLVRSHLSKRNSFCADGCLRGVDYPMLTGSVYIASKTMAKMSTLHAVAPIPAFMALSMPWLGP